MKIYLVDGTYELFRNHFGAPPRKAPDGREIGATLGLMRGMLALLTGMESEVKETPAERKARAAGQGGAADIYIACAFDHEITSFRNSLYPGYKTGEGVNPGLLAQFPLAEEAVSALGVVIWPMVEFEADDALAAAAERYQNHPAVEQILLCSTDKDLAQMARGDRVVCWDRRREVIMGEAGVQEKFGVPPRSIPDWLALVGDSADGYPGLPGWGEKSAAAVLARFGRLEDLPEDPKEWGLPAGRAARLAEILAQRREEALLFRRLATLRLDVPIHENVEDLKWRGALERLKPLCAELGIESFLKRVPRWRPD